MLLLTLRDLRCDIDGTPVLNGMNLAIAPGETLGLVGESGSGKSMTALAIMGLLPEHASATGHIDFSGRNLLALDEGALCAIRGAEIGLVFQEPMTALNPLKTVGDQIAEVYRLHEACDDAESLVRARAMMDRVGLQSIPATRFPHELSGGQRQRIVIAMAVACRPKLIIADEPTSALDVTTQAQILDMLRELTRETGASLLLISHDLAIVAAMASRIAVMKDGAIVEEVPREDLFAMRQSYSQQLLAAAIYRPERPRVENTKAPFFLAEHCTRLYRQHGWLKRNRAPLRAVDDVSLSIASGESIGLVGESGSGKSTLARALLGLDPWDAGTLTLDGRNVDLRKHQDRLALRRKVQLVFQDPYSSFDPRRKIGWSLAEPLALLNEAIDEKMRREKVTNLLNQVGLSPHFADRYPHEMSGGQRQRAAIARALMTGPELIVLDEPVSALDVSVRAKILDLLADLQEQHRVAYLFITHDLSLLRAITDRTLVMQNGKIIEAGPTVQLLDEPKEAYTRALIAAAPRLDGFARHPSH